MVLISNFKSSSIKHDAHFVNYGPIYCKIDNKAGYALGQRYLVTDMLLPQQAVLLVQCSVHGCRTKRHSKELASSKYIMFYACFLLAKISILITIIVNKCNLLTKLVS